MATRPHDDQDGTPAVPAHKLRIKVLNCLLPKYEPTARLVQIGAFKANRDLLLLVTDGWAKGTPAEKPVGKLLEKLTSGTTHNTKVYQEQLEAFIAELKVQKAEAAVKKMTDPVDEGGCGGSVEGLLMHLPRN